MSLVMNADAIDVMRQARQPMRRYHERWKLLHPMPGVPVLFLDTLNKIYESNIT